MKLPMRRLLPAIGLVIGLCASGADATHIYVDQAAARSGDGSAGQPFQSLQSGIDAARPGDTVYVKAGVYGAIRSVRNGTAESRISVVAEERRNVFVNADGRALDVSHTFHTFDGIVFDGGYGSGQVVRADGADHLELIDVEVRRGTSNCVVLGRVRNVLIANSGIHHCINNFNPEKNADSHGVTGTSVFDLTIRNTEIFLVTGDALQLSPARAAWDNVHIEGSLLWSGTLETAINGWPAGEPIGENAVDTKVDPSVLNGEGGRPRLSVVDTIAFGWEGVISNQAAYNIKENVDAFFDRVTVFDSELAFRFRAPALAHVQNAVIHDVEHAFRLEGGLSDARILNSTVGAGIEGAPFRLVSGSPKNLVLRNLLFLGSTVPAPAASQPSNLAIRRSAFVDAAANNYRLVPGVAAVDSGVALSSVQTDRDGQARPQGGRYDVGAYELIQPSKPVAGPITNSGKEVNRALLAHLLYTWQQQP